MALYDINGNLIASDGGGSLSDTVGLANLSDELVNKVLVVDENTQIINLLDALKSVVGRVIDGVYNQHYPNYYSSDYIAVSAGQTYVAQSWDDSGNTGYDLVAFFDENKSYIKGFETGGNGTIRYVIFTPEVNGFIRYTYTYSETANPMVFVGTETTDTFVPYTGKTLDGEYFYKVASEFKHMIQRDVEPSNLFGKTVYVIGDSNADNWSSGIAKSELAKRYGCEIKSYAKYGATWESSTGVDDTATSNAVGQWNAFIAEVGIDEETYTVPDNVVLLFMMGTNCGAKGEIGSPVSVTSKDVSTAIGAENYILQLARYYCRNTSIGVVLPWCGATNTELKELCDYYKIPTFDLPSILCEDEPTKGIVRPDGTTVSQNYFTDGGNHFAEWGAKAITRIMHPWIAYQI